MFRFVRYWRFVLSSFFPLLPFFYYSRDDEAKGKARVAPLLSSPLLLHGRGWRPLARPPAFKAMYEKLPYLPPLFFSCEYLFTVTVLLWHACMDGPTVNAWGLRGTPSPGSSRPVIFPIIKQWSAISFPCSLRFPWRCFGCFPFITAFSLILVARLDQQGTHCAILCAVPSWYVPVFSVYLLASSVFN